MKGGGSEHEAEGVAEQYPVPLRWPPGYALRLKWIRLPGKHWFTDALLPAWAVGAWVAGSVHQPNTAVSSLVVFLMSFVLA